MCAGIPRKLSNRRVTTPVPSRSSASPGSGRAWFTLQRPSQNVSPAAVVTKNGGGIANDVTPLLRPLPPVIARLDRSVQATLQAQRPMGRNESDGLPIITNERGTPRCRPRCTWKPRVQGFSASITPPLHTNTLCHQCYVLKFTGHHGWRYDNNKRLF